MFLKIKQGENCSRSDLGQTALIDEPYISDLFSYGYEWCHERYKELKNKSGNHRRALKDFELLKSLFID